jgi:hypothetical protein
MNLLTSTIVLMSAERPEFDTLDNLHRTIELENLLLDGEFLYNYATGVWKGATEHSFIIALKPDGKQTDQVEFLAGLAKQFNQEAILVVSTDRTAQLIYPATGVTENLSGLFQSITAERAGLLDAYTEFKGGFYAVI